VIRDDGVGRGDVQLFCRAPRRPRTGDLVSADKRPLIADELRTYWKSIEKLPGLRGRCLRLHLLSGGQRIEQLVRLRCRSRRATLIRSADWVAMSSR
jgi:hypothetical protein